VRRGLRRAEDLMPGTGSRVQSRGDSDKLALPAGTKSVQEPEASGEEVWRRKVKAESNIE